MSLSVFPGKHLQSSLMLVVKTRNLPNSGVPEMLHLGKPQSHLQTLD